VAPADNQPLSAARILDEPLAARPDAEAVVARSGRWTYRQLDAEADRLAQALVAAGLRPGDRLAVSLGNDLPLVALFHAAMRVGLVWVGVNRALAPPEKAYLLDDSDAVAFIADTAPDGALSCRPDGSRRRLLAVDAGAGSEWSGLLTAGADLPPPPDPLAAAAIAYTSGTTGFPKGAVHSQHNLVLPGRMLVASRGYGPGLRKADCFPLTILNLQVLSTLLVPQCGGAAIVMDRVDPVGIADWLAAERATTWNGAPAMLYGLAYSDDVQPEQLASLDDVWSGGSYCPPATAERFEAKFGHVVHPSYGSTEVPTVVTLAPRGVQPDLSASGTPLPHLAVHILAEDGHERPPGEDGEICVGPSADPAFRSLYRPMLGYWNQPEATRQALRGGVLHTGDIGSVDDNGALVVRDRQTSLILRGGANVYPAEVSRVVDAFPGVAASCVLGVPDDRLGARVVAVIELNGDIDRVAFDLDGLAAHCRANLARYKVPERFFIALLARNAMGKVVTAEVRRGLGAVDLDAAPTT
jgi:long-chain acyl-CoA synthetase